MTVATIIETELKQNMRGAKEIFDAATRCAILDVLSRAMLIKQTRFGAVEEYVAFDNAGCGFLTVRDNYNSGRSTITFNGRNYTKVERRYFNGDVNHRLTDAESPANLNTINESDYSEIYGIVATRADRSR